MYPTLKRVIDSPLAMIFLVVLAPAWLIVSIAVKGGSKGPVFIRPM